MTKMNKRPEWCPHETCQVLILQQDQVCAGLLPEPEPHDGGENTHRFCLRGADDDDVEWVFDLQVNTTDTWAFRRALNEIDGRGV